MGAKPTKAQLRLSKINLRSSLKKMGLGNFEDFNNTAAGWGEEGWCGSEPAPVHIVVTFVFALHLVLHPSDM